MELFLARDESALSEASSQYGARLMSIAMGVVGDRAAAEECVNDAYLKAWNSIPPNRPYGYLFSYLGRIVRCTAIDRAEHERAQKRGAPVTELTRELSECIPADVVRHKGHALRSGVRGNQHIQRTNRCSAALKIGADLTVLRSRCRSKGKNAQGNQKAKQRLLVLYGIGAVLHSIPRRIGRSLLQPYMSVQR